MLVEANIVPGASNNIRDFTRSELASVFEYLRAREEATDG